LQLVVRGLDGFTLAALELPYVVLVHLRLGLFPLVVPLLEGHHRLGARSLWPQNLGWVLGEVLDVKLLGFEPIGQLIHKVELDADSVALDLRGHGDGVVRPPKLRGEPTYLGLVNLAEPRVFPRRILVDLTSRLNGPVERTDFCVSGYSPGRDEVCKYLTRVFAQGVIHPGRVRSTLHAHFLFKLPTSSEDPWALQDTFFKEVPRF